MTDLRVPVDGVDKPTGIQRSAADGDMRVIDEAALRIDVSNALAKGTSLRIMLQECAEAIVTHVGSSRVRIWTVRRGSDVLELQANAGGVTRLNDAYTRVRVGDLAIGRIASTRSSHVTNDVRSDPRIESGMLAPHEDAVAFAGYPLVVDEHAIGVMAIIAARAIGADALNAIQFVATELARGIERKRSEDELRRSEAYLAEAQQLAHMGSWAWTLATGELYFSREWLRIYGFEHTDRPPTYDAILARAHPDDAPIVDQALADAFRDGTELRLLTRICVPGQPMKWVETYGHPVRDEDDSLIEFVGTVIDVTERRRASRRLRRATKVRFEAVLAERARIARDMHDGLLQDLTAIALQLGALLPHVRTTPDFAAERLAGTLELLQRTARAARAAVGGMRERANGADLVSAVQDVTRRLLANAPLTLTIRVTGKPREVTTPVLDLALSVVHEAVTNVLKHAGARSVSLTVSYRARTCRLSVRDDGSGIAAVGNGDGLGHVGMRERATAGGASFTVRSVPGRGTTVMIEIPYQR